MNDVTTTARYLVILRRWWFVPVGVLVVGLSITALTLPEEAQELTAEQLADPDATFRATHLLIRNDGSLEPVNFDLVELLARQGDLTSRVLERMDGRIDTEQVDEIELVTDDELGTIAVTSTQSSPQLAARLVTVYAEELQSIVDDRAARALRQSLQRVEERLPLLAAEIETIEEEVAALEPSDPEADIGLDQRLLEAELEVLIGEFAISQAEARSLAVRLNELESQFLTLQEPSPVATDAFDTGLLGLPQSPALRFTILGLLSLLAGVGLVLVIDHLDTRVRTRADAEAAFGLPVIAELPPRSKKDRAEAPIPVVSDPAGITAESFRSLRLSTLLAPIWRLAGTSPTGDGAAGSVATRDRAAEPRVFLVTSPLMGDGKSTTAANLAASFAESGQKVLVVDGDFRRPAVGALLGVTHGPGLRDISDPSEPSLHELVVPTDVTGVSMIPAGTPGIAPSWFLSDAAKFLALARELADVVIVDTGPITLTSEASALIPSIDSVVLVLRSGRVTRAQARGTLEQLTRLGASMAGIVLVGTHGAKRYGYYAPHTTSEDEEKAPLS